MYPNKYKILYKFSRNKRKHYYVPFALKQTLSLELPILTVLTSSDLHGTKKILHAHKFKAPSVLQSQGPKVCCVLRNIHETVLSLVSYHRLSGRGGQIYMWSRIEIGGARSCIFACGIFLVLQLNIADSMKAKDLASIRLSDYFISFTGRLRPR